jgi:Uma2 family endonuclease
MRLPVERHRFTVSEYLRLEREAQERHEFRDGEILAMAGGTVNHSLICVNFAAELRAALKGKPCRVYESNLRVRIPRTPLYTYAEALVICGKLEYDPADESLQTIVNPTLLAEVLSPTTEGYDRGEKFRRYREIESLKEYVLISQDATNVETFFRQPDGTWVLAAAAGLEANIRLASLGVELSLSEIFAGVEFSPIPPVATEPTA